MMSSSTDGFHFLYEMKADHEPGRPPVLSVSCISDTTGFEFAPTGESDYFPVDDYLVKPVPPAELLEHVEALLAKGRQRA
jgi:DNA-binding response OmpR family regulator